MGKKRGLLAGPKISNKHQTMSREGAFIVVEAKALDLVSKVILGEIKPVRPSKQRIKFTVLDAGLQIKIRGTNLMQTIRIYTKEQGTVQDLLQERFDKRYP